MNEKAIRQFVQVVRDGSLTVAARRLGLTQPALTAALHRLEREAGAALFERVANRLVLNPAGEAFHRHAFRLLEEFASLRANIRATDGATRGELSVLAGGTALNYILPEVLAAYRQRFPGVRLLVSEGDASDARGNLSSGEFQVMVVTLESIRRELGAAARRWESLELMRDELVFAGSARHFPVGYRFLRRLPTLDFIHYHRSSAIREIVEEHFRRLDAWPREVMALRSTDLMKSMLLSSDAAAILSSLSITATERDQFITRRAGPRGLYRTIGLLYASDRYVPEYVRQFVQEMVRACSARQQR